MSFRPVNLFEKESYISHQIAGIPFVERLPISDGSKKLKTIVNGTTVREVLKVCQVELEQLNKQLPCAENKVALLSIGEAITYLDAREKDRRRRGVEGFHLP
jgi:hypothetical protein